MPKLAPTFALSAGVLALSSWTTAARAGGLSLDPAHPPVQLEGDRVRFPAGDHHVNLQVLPAVVVHASAHTPPHPAARSLGGRSWHIPTSSVAEALTLSMQLKDQPGVDAVFPDIAHPARPMAGDPNREGQWYLDSIEMDPLHAVSLGDPAVRVAVIDSGIDIEHPDLVDRVEAPYDAFDDDDDPSPNPGEYCYDGSGRVCDEHGTAVSGVIAATANNDVGIHGMCPECTLIPIKMLGEGGGALSADVAAFEHAIAQDAAVINNSWGYTVRIAVPEPLEAVVLRALVEPRDGLGAVVVFAAGNDNREVGDEELQAIPGVMCVSAIDNYGYSTSYTNFGGPIDVAAPSATVSITPTDDYTTDFGGTSAAAPVVSGLAAWILSVEPGLTAEEVTELIVGTATESPYVTHDDSGHHDIYGYGVITPPLVLEALTGAGDAEDPDDPDGSEDSGEPTEAPESTGGEADTDKGGCTVASSGASSALALWAMGLVVLARRKPAGLQAVR